MTRIRRLLSSLLILGVFSSGLCSARSMTADQVPEPLKPWIDWVLWEHQERDCPMLYNSEQRRCIWPAELQFKLNDNGGRFSQRLTVFLKSRVSLPGSNAYWPGEVTVDGLPAEIIAYQGTPQIWLPPGEYRVEGRFLWERLPESLPVPADTGLISLRVNGEQRGFPEIKQDQLWLRERDAKVERTPEDRVHVDVFRRVIDGHPMRVITWLKLEVSGKQREAVLGQPLLQGFIPQEIKSQLPARLEPDGRLRVQLRPGQWDLEIHALHPDYLTALTAIAQPAPWPAQETWSFEAQPSLRLVEVEGAPQVDPRQTRLPPAWRSLPAYQMKPETVLRLNVVRRGNPQPEPDKLQLQRDLWLDFDGQGYTLQDRITGQMTAGWRLAVTPELDLGRVTLDGEPQFITRLDTEKTKGLEVRHGAIDLVAESRIDGPRRNLPASGWGRAFQQAGARLHLPPGWRLFAVSGVDAEHHSWLQKWTLYDLFLVFVISAAVGKLWGWRWSLPALLTLALIWHEPQAPRHIWLYLLAVTALLRILPAGKYQTAAHLARAVGLALLVVITLPFMVDQARTGLYPQLAYPGQIRLPATEAEMMPQTTSAPIEAPRRKQAMDYMEKKLSSVSGAVSQVAKSPYPSRWQSDPKANIQTGPGLPSWQWRQIPLNWNGPMAEDQRIGLTLVGPGINLGLNLLRILLLLLLAWRFSDWRTLPSPNRGAGAGALMLLSLNMLGAPDTALAGPPSQELLKQLEQRLIQPPDCLPQCADIQRLGLELSETRLNARLRVHATEATAIPLPIDTRQQNPLQVLLDDQPSHLLARDESGQLWIQVGGGQHEILLSAGLPDRQQLQIPLPLTPHRVEVTSAFWTVEGLRENQVPDRQLHLTRKQLKGPSSKKPTDSLAPQLLPPFVQVERTLRLGLEWSVETRVKRLSPAGTPIVLHLPLLANEAVITEGVRVKNGKALVNMGPTTRETLWRSRLPISTQIKLTAPRTSQWVEQWRLDVGPVWHARIEGIAPTHHQDRERWLPSWQPWPGESVTLELTRPEGVEGPTRTIDRSSLTLSPGKRASDATLEFRLRSSQGGRHDVVLPEQARLLSVRIDRKSQPIRPEGNRVSLPVHPGQQTYQLEWRQEQGIRGQWHTPMVDLGLGSVNSQMRVQLGQDRWVLFATGPKLGPAVLFWGELLMILLVAVILGRLKGYSPLGMVSWLLLGIGLSQVSIWSGLLVVGTFFAFGYRARTAPDLIPRSFNLLQIALVILSLFTLVTLFWAVQQGLLGLPQMQIAGNGSSAYQLNWYQDRASPQLPIASVYSVPLLVYRLLMLAWALWLAFSLLRWVKWAWEAFSHRGRWIEIEVQLPRRRRVKKQPDPKP